MVAEDRDATTYTVDRYLYRLSHPLGEHVVTAAKQTPTPTAKIQFDVTGHPTRIHVIEELKGHAGYAALVHQTIQSYETQEYLLFSGFDDNGRSIDQETMERLFQCAGTVGDNPIIADEIRSHLETESAVHTKANVSRSLESNSKHFQAAREKLESWADDMVLAAEKSLRDTKERIKVKQREARQATTLAEQHAIQEEIQKLEKTKRRQRQDIFKVEDEIMDKRDSLVDALEKRLAQKTASETLFVIRWTVV